VWGLNSNVGDIFHNCPYYPGDQPSLCAMGTRSFLGVNQAGCDISHPSPSGTEVKERAEYGRL